MADEETVRVDIVDLLRENRARLIAGMPILFSRTVEDMVAAGIDRDLVIEAMFAAAVGAPGGRGGAREGYRLAKALALALVGGGYAREQVADAVIVLGTNLTATISGTEFTVAWLRETADRLAQGPDQRFPPDAPVLRH